MTVPRTHGPRVDVHAHPGRCFAAGISPDPSGSPLLTSGDPDRVAAELVEAGMAAVSFATVSDMAVLGFTPDGGLTTVRDFADGEAIVDHRRQLDAIAGFAERSGFPIVRRADDITAAHDAGTCALFVTCEGADFVEGDVGRVAEAHALGVRSITLVHYRPNAYGDIQTAPSVHGGLSAAGRELVAEMNRCGMVIDLAHATYATTLGVLAASTQPVMISHTHLDGRSDHPRLVSHEHAIAVAEAGGLIGAWPAGVAATTFDQFVDEVARLAEVVGVAHVAIGTDMDANYRPVLTNYNQFEQLADALGERGFEPTDVDRILGRNAIDLIRTVCG